MKTGKRFLAAVMAAAALTFASCAKGNADVPAGMVSAGGEMTDYELFVPDDWTVTPGSGVVSAYKSTQDPTSVSVMAFQVPYADTTVEDWWEMYKEDFTLVFTEFQEESSENVLLDGVHGQKYVYTGNLGKYSYRYTQVAAIRAGGVYLITITELAESETDHTEEIAKILENFRWK